MYTGELHCVVVWLALLVYSAAFPGRRLYLNDVGRTGIDIAVSDLVLRDNSRTVDEGGADSGGRGRDPISPPYVLGYPHSVDGVKSPV